MIDESLPRGTPEVWESDLYSGQMSAPVETFQICLAHQHRELKYPIDCGEPIFASRMKEVFREAIQLNEEIN